MWKDLLFWIAFFFSQSDWNLTNSTKNLIVKQNVIILMCVQYLNSCFTVQMPIISIVTLRTHGSSLYLAQCWTRTILVNNFHQQYILQADELNEFNDTTFYVLNISAASISRREPLSARVFITVN